MDDTELSLEINDRDTNAYWQRYARPRNEQFVIQAMNGIRLAAEAINAMSQEVIKGTVLFNKRIRAMRYYVSTMDERVGM